MAWAIFPVLPKTRVVDHERAHCVRCPFVKRNKSRASRKHHGTLPMVFKNRKKQTNGGQEKAQSDGADDNTQPGGSFAEECRAQHQQAIDQPGEHEKRPSASSRAVPSRELRSTLPGGQISQFFGWIGGCGVVVAENGQFDQRGGRR